MAWKKEDKLCHAVFFFFWRLIVFVSPSSVHGFDNYSFTNIEALSWLIFFFKKICSKVDQTFNQMFNEVFLYSIFWLALLQKIFTFLSLLALAICEMKATLAIYITLRLLL